MKATRVLERIFDDNCYITDEEVSEAISELEEIQKEDEYIHQKMKESLSIGNKAQTLAFVEVYQIINNRKSK